MKKLAIVLAAVFALGCQSAVSEIGTLQIRVKWPAERKTQTIPFFAESVRFTVKNSLGTQLGQVTAVRTDATSSVANLILPTGTVTIWGEAFSEATPSVESSPVARGSVGGVRIQASKYTSIKIVLEGLVGVDTAIGAQDEGIAATMSAAQPASTGTDINIDTATASSEGLNFTIE